MSYIDNFDSYWLFASAIAIVIYTFFSFIDGHLAKPYKENFTLWLWGDYQSTWARQFCLLFDNIFGDRHLSWNCFFRSSLASILFVICLYVLFGPVLGYLSDSGRTGENLSLGQAVIFGAILNVIPDYLSLYETRWLLNKFQDSTTLGKQLIFLIIDLVFSSLIILLAIGLFLLSRGQTNVTPAVIIGLFSIFSIFFYSTFFTSIWAWFYCLSTWFMKLFCKTPLKSFLDTETKPLKQIGLISSALIFICAFALSPILKDSDSNISRKIDDMWCKHFESTCERLYYLTEDEKEAYERLENICESGNLNFCINRSVDYFNTDSYKFNKEKYLKLYERICDRGEFIACHLLSTFYHKSHSLFDDKYKIADENPELSFEYMKRACNLGSGSSCFNVAGFYAEGYGVIEDNKIAHDYMIIACDLDVYSSCLLLGHSYNTGNDMVSKDIRKAEKFLKKSCDGDNGNACNLLGELYQVHHKFNKSNSLVAGLYEKACAAYEGYETRCADVVSRTLKLTEKYRENVLEFLLISQNIDNCQYVNVRGCGQLGKLYKKGEGVTRDYKRAAKLLQKACDKGMFEVCVDLGLLYKNGWGIEQDYEKAFDAFSTACNVDIKGCYNLGVMYKFGLGVEKNLQRADELFTKSCTPNFPTGCFSF